MSEIRGGECGAPSELSHRQRSLHAWIPLELLDCGLCNHAWARFLASPLLPLFHRFHDHR